MQPLIHVSERARALVMNPSNPELLFTLLPSTRRVTVAGHQLVAVPHSLDVVSVLRNLGAPAPSPILHHYQWPGRFPPMQAQRQTAAFLTLNRRAFVLNDMGCVDCDTEYLSPTGWVRIADYQGGQVAQYHPDTHQTEFVQPNEYVKRPCAEMIRFRSAATDQLLSPEHRVLLYRDGHGHYVEQAAVAALKLALGDRTIGDDQIWNGSELVTFADEGAEISIEPSPDGFKYCFMVPSTFLLFRRNGCVFASGNTGKTMSALWAFDYLRSIGALRKTIVFAPLSTLNATWASEILLGFPHLKFAVLHADRAKRLKMLEQDNDVYIINHHGVKIVQEALAARPDIDLAIVDELSVFRTPGTDLFKSMQKVTAMPSRWVWGMTGTPTPNAPTDAWAQVRLLRPSQVPNYFKAFKEQTMLQVAPFKWVPRKNSTETVQSVMQPSIRFTRDECMDLPPTTWIYRDVEMSVEQKKLYQEMKTKLRLEYESGQAKAVNEADKAMKLVQIACGAVRDSVTGEPILIPTGQRLEETIAAIHEAKGKVLVFVPFVAALHALRDELAKHWPTALVYGETPKAERDDIFTRFQHGTSDDLHVVVANARVMSHGLTLTSADTVLWYGSPTSHETFDQACHRIIRKGQVRNTRVIMMRGCKVEQELYARLTDRREMQGSLLAAIASEKED